MATLKVIEFNLLDNARDSLRQAIELLAVEQIGTDHARLKHSITASAHCIELLLKERLRRINSAFVWENVDKYPSLEARTVTVDSAIGRLKSIGKVAFSTADERTLKSLRTTRNAIEHYEWRTSEKEAKIIIGNALSFAFAFAQEELEIDLADSFKDDDTWRMLLDELSHFARAHGARLEEVLGRRIAEDLPLQAGIGLVEWEEHEIARVQTDTRISDTTRLALVLARRGQGLFKDRVAKIERACRITGVNRVEHLRASHCKPWRDSSNEERLDGENGLLLTPNADHLFDRGFIGFDDNGDVLISPVVHSGSLARLGIDPRRPPNVGRFSDGQRRYLEFHRESVLLRSRFME